MNKQQKAVRARIAQVLLGEAPQFKTIMDNTPMKTRVNRINTFLADKIGKDYYTHIPLADIFGKCEENQLYPVDDDNTPWMGFLTGKEGTAHIALSDKPGDDPMTSVQQAKEDRGKIVKHLHISWYKMQSGRFEVTAYVN